MIHPVIREQFFKLWPELLNYENKIKLFHTDLDPYNKITPVEIANLLRLAKTCGMTKFVFHCGNEPILPYNIKKLQKVVDILAGEIDSKNIFYIATGVHSQQVYNEWAIMYNWQHKVNILTCHFWEAFIEGRTTFKHIGYETKIKSKKFLSFNRVSREHRIQLLDRMLENNHVEKAYYSFEGIPGWLDELDSFDEYKNIKANKHLFPLKLNIQETRIASPADMIFEDLQYFADSYFSLVTETCFYKEVSGHHHISTPDAHISEKTIKPIMAKHPFILVGAPNLLGELRKIGYKTFHPYIDETYDTIEDDTARLDAIVKEVERLCTKSDDEWLQWQIDITDIIEHNHQNFYTRTDHRITKDVEQYFESP